MSEKIIFSMSGVTKTYPPSKTVLKNIWLSFYYGAKIGVLGLNGSGKSTLLKIIAGLDQNYQGKIEFEKQFKIGYLEQEPTMDNTKTVRQVVEEGVQKIVDFLKENEEIGIKLGEVTDDDEMMRLIERQGEVLEEIENHNGWELDYRLDVFMDALRCPPNDAMISTCSGGERRRVALARLLLSQPDILLLDEPTNHLDAESVNWLEQYLKVFPGTVIAVTHDRYFLDNVAGWILELDRGEGIPWEGNYSTWLDAKAKRLAQEERQDDRRKKALERELDWVRMNAKGRQSKGKARLSAYDKMAGEEGREKESKLELWIPNGQRLGDQVIEVENLTKSFGDRILFENLIFSIPKNAIIGVLGPNGVGKSTLFKILTGREKADSGTVTYGSTVQTSYVDQSHEGLLPEKTIYEIVSEGNDLITVGNTSVNARAYLSRFNFAGQDQQKKLAVCSGGERNRVHLAMTLKEGGNVLLLDEPTNDIDLNTLRALEDALEDFAGCAIIISHDRFFIDRLATHILAFEDNAEVVFFEGNFSDYEASKRARLGDVPPSRPKLKHIL
jgi:energy-dependent translational throttle protein EttA